MFRGFVMKNKYQRLTKEEKKECRKMYYRTIPGKAMRTRLIRLIILGILGLCYGTYLFANGIFTHSIQWYDYCMGIPLLLFSVVFIVGAIWVRLRVLNQFALKIPRFKNK